MSGIKGYSSWPSVRLPIDIVRIAVTGAWTLAKATAFVYGEVVTVTPMASSVGGGGGPAAWCWPQATARWRAFENGTKFFCLIAQVGTYQVNCGIENEAFFVFFYFFIYITSPLGSISSGGGGGGVYSMLRSCCRYPEMCSATHRHAFDKSQNIW